jgi:endonuclease YncB( thermonuclease family)
MTSMTRILVMMAITAAAVSSVMPNSIGLGLPQVSAAAQAPPRARPTGTRIAVTRDRISVDDGDTIAVRWSETHVETIRILGIDSPETRHLEHDIPYGQPFGEEARAFAMGAFRAATRIELVRATSRDPYDRTLAYVFLDGQNYSVMIIEARLAQESISQFGDNGFPAEAAAVRKAASAAGPLAFEPPSAFRRRMSDLSRWLKAQGRYPTK